MADKSIPAQGDNPVSEHFPIVGIGASAGGLEAFLNFLTHVPTDLDIGYVFVQHLSPNYESLLPEILNRNTQMKVYSVTDNMKLEKNNVYVIPPGNTLTITDGHLQLIPQPSDKRNLHPIDYFLTALAEVYKNKAIGVILSGTGTDGALGLKSIKAEGGITFAQDDSAKYKGMPGHANDMGYVDFVGSPTEIANELAALINHPLAHKDPVEFTAELKNEQSKINAILNTKKGVDFSSYKQSTIQRRIMRRMLLNRLDTLEDYTRMLRENNNETEALYQDLLINVTSLFREPLMEQELTDHVLPALVKDRKNEDPLRVWVAGCATGEEAVTMAIILMEYMKKQYIALPVQIFATDLNEKAISKARLGLYAKSVVQALSEQRLKDYFIRVDGHYQVIKEIRDICVFAQHNLLKDPPFSRMDIISCQNLLIYLENSSQKRILHAFHYALKPGGFLVLGKSESISTAVDRFEPYSKRFKIYIRKNINAPVLFDFVPRSYPVNRQENESDKKFTENRKEFDTEHESDKILLAGYVPPNILVNKDLEILRFRGPVAPYIEPAAGKASLQMMKMLKEEIAFELRTLILKIKKDQVAIRKEKIFFNSLSKHVTIDIEPVKQNDKDIHYLIIFTEENIALPAEQQKTLFANDADAKNAQINLLQKQLKEARENIKGISEEFEVTREELQATNEEVLSSNEELQSINEELETSKEELQSTNEELITINEELNKRNAELKDLNDYADAIFETKHESLIILNKELRVKIANKGFYNTFRLTQAATEGNYLNELAENQWNLPELEAEIRAMQSTHAPIINLEIDHEFKDVGFKSILVNVVRLSIKKDKDVLYLVAIHDITERKAAEQKIKDSAEYFRLLIKNSFDIIAVFDEHLHMTYQSESVTSVLGYENIEKAPESFFPDFKIHPDDLYKKDSMFKDCLQKPGKNIRAEFRVLHQNGTYRYMDIICINLLSDRRVKGIVVNYRDITERKLLEQQKDTFVGMASHELKTPMASLKGYVDILLEEIQNKKSMHPPVDILLRINKQIDRLTLLINDLLDYTYIETGKIKFREEKFNLNTLITETAADIQKTSKSHSIILKLDNEVELTGDRYRIGEVLINLLTNAIKYSRGANEVIVSTKTDPEKVTVTVKDFGIGIPRENQEKIFEQFYRLNDSKLGTYPGLGLGLYISAQIIKRQRGSIYADSVEGKGSEFSFTLPLNN